MVLASMFPCETLDASTQGSERKKMVFGSSYRMSGLGARLDIPVNKGKVQWCISPSEELGVKFLHVTQPGLGASRTHPP